MLTENSRCPKCAKEERVYISEEQRVELEEKFIHESKKIFGDLYDYSKVHYVDSSTPVEIICKKCGRTFSKRPGNHTYLK